MISNFSGDVIRKCLQRSEKFRRTTASGSLRDHLQKWHGFMIDEPVQKRFSIAGSLNESGSVPIDHVQQYMENAVPRWVVNTMLPSTVIGQERFERNASCH